MIMQKIMQAIRKDCGKAYVLELKVNNVRIVNNKVFHASCVN